MVLIMIAKKEESEKVVFPEIKACGVELIDVYTESMLPEYFAKFINTNFGAEHGRQKLAAEFFGVSKQFINNVLAGKRKPSAEMLEKIGLKASKIVYFKRIDCGEKNGND